MKKQFTFTVTITDITPNKTVMGIIEKVQEEQRIKLQIEENNNAIHRKMQEILDIVRGEIEELVEPLGLTLSTHYSQRKDVPLGRANSRGLNIETQIGGPKEHSSNYSSRVIIRVYCPLNGGALVFKPSIRVFTENIGCRGEEVEYTSGENLIKEFSETIEQMYRNNLN